MIEKKQLRSKQKSIEETLWDSANKLRGTVEPSEYKHVVLGLIFLKFASDKFEERRKELLAEGKEKYLEMVEFYTMKNVFYLPEVSRWSYLMENARQNDIALKIDTALFTVEKNNPALKGALPDNYYSRLNLDVAKLASLLSTIHLRLSIAFDWCWSLKKVFSGTSPKLAEIPRIAKFIFANL